MTTAWLPSTLSLLTRSKARRTFRTRSSTWSRVRAAAALNSLEFFTNLWTEPARAMFRPAVRTQLYSRFIYSMGSPLKKGQFYHDYKIFLVPVVVVMRFPVIPVVLGGAMALGHVPVHPAPAPTAGIIALPELITNLWKEASQCGSIPYIICYLPTTPASAELAALAEARVQVDADVALVQLHPIKVLFALQRILPGVVPKEELRPHTLNIRSFDTQQSRSRRASCRSGPGP